MADYIIHLPERPTENGVYTIDKVNFAWPCFRLKNVPDAFYFDKNASGVIVLNCTIEVYSKKENTCPFYLNNPEITISYETNTSKKKKTFTVTDFQNAPSTANIREIKARLSVSSLNDELIKALSHPNYKVTLTVDAYLMWQQKTVESSPVEPNKIPIGNLLNKNIAQNQVTLSQSSRQLQASTVQNYTAIKVNTSLVRPNENQATSTSAQPQPQPSPPPPPPAPPVKINLKQSFTLDTFDRDASNVFEKIPEKRIWVTEHITSDNKITIHYQKSKRLDTYNLLPQEYRIKVSEETNLPKISFTMISGKNPDETEFYKIRVMFDVGHYYHPKSRTDLYNTLKNEDKTFKYCDVAFSGYKSATFEWRSTFLEELSKFQSKVLENDSMKSFIAEEGISIGVECSLDYFDLFKSKIVDDFMVGNVIFEVEEASTTKKIPIPVKLNVCKLTQIKFKEGVVKFLSFPKGATLSHRYQYALNIEGCVMTFFRKKNNRIVDANYHDIKTAFLLNPNETVTQPVSFMKMVSLIFKAGKWKELKCEPFGVTFSEEVAQQIIGQVIDKASNSIQEWTLTVISPILEGWNELDAETKEQFKHLSSILVQVKTEPNTIKDVCLTKNAPTQRIKMSSTLSGIFKTQQIDARNYQYRQQTVFTDSKTVWSEWIEADSADANYLFIKPKK